MESHVRQRFIAKLVIRNFCREKDKLHNEVLYVSADFTFKIERMRTSDAYMKKICTIQISLRVLNNQK